MDCNDSALLVLIVTLVTALAILTHPRWRFPAVVEFIVQHLFLSVLLNFILWGYGREYVPILEEYIPVPSYLWVFVVSLVLTILLRLVNLSLELLGAAGLSILVTQGVPVRAALPVIVVIGGLFFVLTMVRRFRRVGRLMAMSVSLGFLVACSAVGLLEHVGYPVISPLPPPLVPTSLGNETNIMAPANCSTGYTNVIVSCDANCFSVLGDTTSESLSRITVIAGATGVLAILRLLVFSLFFSDTPHQEDEPAQTRDTEQRRQYKRQKRKTKRKKRGETRAAKGKDRRWEELTSDEGSDEEKLPV